jgi:hypothetical protein
MTDFRALCAELVDALKDENTYTIRIEMIDRARAALAEDPVGPTRKETVDLYSEVMAAHDCQTLGEMAEHFARAVLARWGAPAAVPTPEAKPTPSLKEPTPIETVCYYDDPENLPYFVGN